MGEQHLDNDFVSPYTSEFAVEALKNGNTADFFLWYKQDELALGEHPTASASAEFLQRVAGNYEKAEKLDEALVFLERAAALNGVDETIAEKTIDRLKSLRMRIAGAALEKGDIATYHMWVQSMERAMGDAPDPKEKSDFLVVRAMMHRKANDYPGAVELLKQSLRLIRDLDVQRAEMTTVLMRQLDGDKAVQEVESEGKNERLNAVKQEYVQVQQQLIALGAREWEKKSDEQIAEIARLKVRFDELTKLRTELMR